MKFLLDVNASGILSTLLLELSHDIACVNSVDAKMSDDEILNWAVREERIIITTDSDFEQMIWLQDRIHCGVLRLENLPRLERMALIQEVLTNYAVDLASGCVVIATKQKIRIRRKPKVIENINEKLSSN
jgi:predicted nuclease of predicted toxin-antitoxin system